MKSNSIPPRGRFCKKGKPVELTSVEFNLLHVLLREAGRVVPRERLVDIVLSRKFSPFDRSIDMHVSKIRKKLGESDSGLDHIKTVRGVGYIFTRPQEVAGRQGQERRTMKSLFLKIFLSYWVAQALFVALAILITVAVRERGESAAWDAQQAAVLEKAVQTYEQSGPTEARRYFEEVARLVSRSGLPARRPWPGCLRTRSAALGGVSGKGS